MFNNNEKIKTILLKPNIYYIYYYILKPNRSIISLFSILYHLTIFYIMSTILKLNFKNHIVSQINK